MAENEEESPFEPLHVARGFAAEDSTVTVVGAEAPHSILGKLEASTPQVADELINVLARVAANPGSNSAYFDTGDITVVLNPAHARVLSNAGYDRAAIQYELAERSRTRRGDLRAYNSFLVPDGGDDLLMPERDPKQFIVLVSGADGKYSVVCPPWCAGPNGNKASTKKITTDFSC
jgi:hypothetical protein